jgi:cytochrome c
MLRSLTIALALTGATTAAQADGDAKAGADVFKKCAMCHTTDKGGSNGLGPNLFGVVGRKAGTLNDFQYSGKLKASGIIWTPDNLTKWVARPAALVPGTKMSFAGISSKNQQANVVAYLQTLK